MVDEFLRYGKSEEEYEQIKREVISNRVPDRLPKLILLAGVPGSGKSTINQALTSNISDNDKEGFDLIISPDDVKLEIMQRLEVSEEHEVEWRKNYQSEAWEITRDTMFRSFQRGHNVIYDATLGNTKKYMEIFDFIKAHNLEYEIELNLVHVNLPVALYRAYERGLTDKHTVPEAAIKHIHKVIPSNIIDLFPYIDIFTFWDNNTEQPPSNPIEVIDYFNLFDILNQNRFLKMIVNHQTSEIYVELADGCQLDVFFAEEYDSFLYKLRQYDVEFMDAEHNFLNS